MGLFLSFLPAMKAAVRAGCCLREGNNMLERRGMIASRSNEYRYVLWRMWGVPDSLCAFVMLNPSTADEVRPDPTITKCIGFAKRWNYSGIVVVNLFALRATYPRELRKSSVPVGVHNVFYTQKVLGHPSVHRVVVAWGNDGTLLAAGERFFVMYANQELHCLKPPGAEALTRQREPRHPGRIGYDCELVRVGWNDGMVNVLGGTDG